MRQYLGWHKIYLKKEINTVIRKDFFFSKKLGLLKSVPAISNMKHEIIPKTTVTPKFSKFYQAKGKLVFYQI